MIDYYYGYYLDADGRLMRHISWTNKREYRGGLYVLSLVDIDTFVHSKNELPEDIIKLTSTVNRLFS